MSRDDPPLIAGAIHGVRTWRVEWSDGDARLAAPVYGGGWAARGEPTRASCEAAGRAHRGRRAPARSCSCGLYALHPRDEAIADLEQLGSRGDEPLGTVAGIVEAWGRVELHEDGFRAEYARPKALAAIGTAPGSDEELLIERIAERHGAAVLRLRRIADLIAHCREHGLGLDEGVVRSLLPEPEPPAPEHPVPPPAPRAGARSRLKRLGERAAEIALMAVGGLLILAWYGIWAGVAVVFVIGMIEGWSGEQATSAGELRVVEQALVEVDDGLRYVAVVENASDDEAALRVVARGRLLDRGGVELARLDRPGEIDHRPNLAPGERGLVVDRIDGAGRLDPGDVASYDVELRARRTAMAAEAPGQPAFHRAEAEGARCTLTAVVDPGPVERPRVAILARDRGGAIASGGYLRAGPIAAGTGRRVLARGDGPCPPFVDSVEVFASPTVAELLGT